MDENRVGEGTPGLPLAARRSINMLPRSGTREPPLWQANLSLAAKFRGPLLSGPLGSPCFRARYRDRENKECRPAARHRRPYFANNFCDRILPLQRRDFVFWKELGVADNFWRTTTVSCLSLVLARKCLFLNLWITCLLTREKYISLSRCHFEFFRLDLWTRSN